MNRCWQLFLN